MNRIAIILVVLLAAGAIFFLALSRGSGEFAAGARVFRMPLEENPPDLDPVKISDVTSDGVAQKIFEPLIKLDKDLKPQPCLLEAMPQWDAATNSYTFVLKKGVTFHNGREMKAEDVRYSWERLLDPAVSDRTEILASILGAEAKIAGKAQETEGIQVVDEYTVKVRLKGPDPIFLIQITMVCAAVIPKEAVEEANRAQKSFGAMAVGTGPFKLANWVPDQKLVLRRHDAYHGGKPMLDGILFEMIPEASIRLERYQKGEFDCCDIPFGQLKTVSVSHGPHIARNKALRTNYMGIVVNRRDAEDKIVPVEPLGSNLKLRQAMNHAINRKHICETILEGRSQPAKSILPPGLMGHDPELHGWSYDPEKSKQLLAEAGFPEGKDLKPFELYYVKRDDVEKVALAIQNDLQAVGFKIELRNLEWGAFLKKIYNDPPELFLLGWIADYPDPDNFLLWLFHTKQWGKPGNETRYHNPEVDALVDTARYLMNQEERKHLYNQAEKIILDDCSWILLEWRENVILVNPRVVNAKEQLGLLDVGWYMNNVNFSKVDIRE